MISPLSRSTTVLKTAIAGLLSLLPISLPALGAEKVIIASTGGAYDKALRRPGSIHSRRQRASR